MCLISVKEENVSLFIDVLFVLLPNVDAEISSSCLYGGRPLVSILHILMYLLHKKSTKSREHTFIGE